MKINRNKTTRVLIIILAVALLIEVGYALLSSTLRINGNTKISRAGWDVHFENVQVTDGSVTADTAATIDEAKTTVNYVVTLAKPGDFYEFTVDAVNKGTIDAMVSFVNNLGITEAQQKYLTYFVKYSSGAAVAEKQLLAADAKETLKVRVEFKKDITAADLPTEPETLPLEFRVDYVQADDTGEPVDHPVCRRATTLHTEICNISNHFCAASYAVGAPVTYGNLGTEGVALAAGDALDCDVNGDGTYDAATERFYYVSDLDSNSSYAVLAYYNNVADGGANNTAKFAYDAANTPKTNGPVTAKAQLPTTTQWSNVSLASTTRKIIDQDNVEFIDFSYEGYAARLLTLKEIGTACGVTLGSYTAGELEGCQYLMENTKYTNSSLTYGYWLESVSFGTKHVWVLYSGDSNITNDVANNAAVFGIRPAIEVLKTDILV